MEDKYRVFFFEKDNNTCPVEDFLNALDDKISAKIYRTLEILENNGPELREPYSKHLDDGIFELRIKFSTNLARILYFFYIEKRIIVTHGFTKKTKKTPSSEIERAKAYRMEFLDKETHGNENS